MSQYPWNEKNNTFISLRSLYNPFDNFNLLLRVNTRSSLLLLVSIFWGDNTLQPYDKKNFMTTFYGWGSTASRL